MFCLCLSLRYSCSLGYSLPTSSRYCYIFEFIDVVERKALYYDQNDIVLVGSRDLSLPYDLNGYLYLRDD
jgi:hypothetical protein